MVLCALRAPAVGVACLAPVKREITFPLLTGIISPGVWVHPSYGVRTDRPHSVWSCALSEGTCGGRCLPCTSQEEITFPLLTEYALISPEYGFTPVMGCAQIDHTPYGLVRSPRAPAVGVACLAPVKREITFPLLTEYANISGSMGSPQLWGAHR